MNRKTAIKSKRKPKRKHFELVIPKGTRVTDWIVPTFLDGQIDHYPFALNDRDADNLPSAKRDE